MSADLKTTEYWTALARSLRPDTGLFIDGAFVDAADGRRFETINPADDSVLATVARGGAIDIDRAVASARRAFRTAPWARIAPRARMAVLYRFADLIEAHAEAFAVLDAQDMGKPIAEMLTIDVPGSLACFRFMAEAADKITGMTTATGEDALHYILRQPLGVVGCIVPWNYPLMMAAWKIAPALAAGNAVVLKPAEQSPLSALLLGRLFVEAGGPPGILNVVPGYGEEAGQALARHMDVDKIAFTGSGEVGGLMMVYAGQSNLKHVSTECGGKSPHVIMADVEDLEAAVNTAVAGIYGNQGEVCSAGSRILVERAILGDVVEAFTARTRATVRIGNPLDPATTLGPLVTRSHQKRVLSYIDIGRDEGARLAFGGAVPAGHNSGAWVEPTLFADVGNGMRIAREEIFGPVGAVIGFDGPDEALRIANDTVYGLAAGVWTRDLGKAHRFAAGVECGMVWVNGYMNGDMTQPWGGWKQTGNGRDKCFDAIVAHTQTKSVWVTLG
ncbi:aldehyde dehydrogenase family protein (plasmid) [Tistrella bauzanensis]|uniref:Aldehyde dehydrogenase family protein n=1 Tax=Tistrella arctica TaxID=3133430 RepID=A0ABU9YP78_9PROT